MKSTIKTKVLSLFGRRPQESPIGHLHSYCLGLDIVGYSKYTTDVQLRMIKRIQENIRNSRVLTSVENKNLVYLPTGDGMIICLLESEESPTLIVRLAEELQQSLREQNRRVDQDERIVIRIGIHSGTGASYVDINDKTNIAGTVANMTQRVMDFGQEWHILASKNAFDDIATLDKEIQKLFHSIGIGEAKHKVSIELYNLYRLDSPAFGNPETPPMIQEIKEVPTHSKLIEKVVFDYSDSPANHGWRVSESTVAGQPTLSSLEDANYRRVLQIRSTVTYALDYDVKSLSQLGSLLEVVVNLESSDSLFYAQITVQSKDRLRSRDVWLAFVIGSEDPRPYGDGSKEWMYPVRPKPRERSWLLFLVDLNEAVSKTFERDGWKFFRLKGIRLRGNLSLAYISILEAP